MFNLDPTKECVGFLVRHGELTRMSVWDGWSSMNLDDDGHEQAEKAAQWLSYEKIGRAICSDLPRTAHTAEYLLATDAVVCPYLACDPNLRPWNVGIFTGKEKTPERIAEFQKYVDDPSLVIPEGESYNQFHLRIQVIFQYLASPYDAKPTAFFIHNSVIKDLMGIPGLKAAVNPGGIIQVLMDETGNISFEVILGHVAPEIGVS